jgi:hypothetical protein
MANCAMTRFGFVMITYTATLSVALTSAFHPAPKLLWNVGASVRSGGAAHASVSCW